LARHGQPVRGAAIGGTICGGQGLRVEVAAADVRIIGSKRQLLRMLAASQAATDGAFGLLERTSIPAIISEGDTDELAIIDNIQREDLSPIDEFQAVARLIDKHGYSQGDAARALGKSRVSINELMSLKGFAASILDEPLAAKVSKSILIEIAHAGEEPAQLGLWAAVREGARTVRAVRVKSTRLCNVC
jgi:ParB-like chromosome segregation protein Spo0J